MDGLDAGVRFRVDGLQGFGTEQDGRLRWFSPLAFYRLGNPLNGRH
jgi:hypothetical protein